MENTANLTHVDDGSGYVSGVILSVVGVSHAGHYFFPHNSTNTPLQNIREDITTHQTLIEEEIPAPTTTREEVSMGGVKSFISNKVHEVLHTTISESGLPANLIKINHEHVASTYGNDVETVLNNIASKISHIEQRSQATTRAADQSITVADDNTVKVNPSGIPYSATINGGTISNLQEFLNVSTATLNTITSLGGVNEGVNQGSSLLHNRGDIFDKKDGTRFYYRTLVSQDSSVRFTQAEDGKTIDLSVRLPIGSVPITSIAHITRQRLLGNSDAGSGSGIVEEIRLDPTLIFTEAGHLAVKKGGDGLHLKDLGGNLSLNQLQPIPSNTILGNGSSVDASPSSLHLNNHHFTLSTNQESQQLSLNTESLASIISPLISTAGRIRQADALNSVDIGQHNNTKPSSALNVFGNGNTLSLLGTDHAYIQFYPRGLTHNRKAFAGFPSVGSNDFVIKNEDVGAVYLRNSANTSAITIAASGKVGINTETPTDTFSIGSHLTYTDNTEKTLNWNAHNDGTNWKYSNTGPAYSWAYTNNNFVLRSASSAQQGNTLAWNNPLVINESGLIGVGTSPVDGYQLNILGSQRILGGSLEIASLNSSGANQPINALLGVDKNGVLTKANPTTAANIILPAQDNKTGSFLTTDGVNAKWEKLPVLEPGYGTVLVNGTALTNKLTAEAGYISTSVNLDSSYEDKFKKGHHIDIFATATISVDTSRMGILNITPFTTSAENTERLVLQGIHNPTVHYDSSSATGLSGTKGLEYSVEATMFQPIQKRLIITGQFYHTGDYLEGFLQCNNGLGAVTEFRMPAGNEIKFALHWNGSGVVVFDNFIIKKG